MSKLYVGNLSFSTTEETLRQTFEADGRKVNRISLILDRETGRSRGFAFIEMSSPADAEAAIAACNELELDGRRLRVNPAVERESRGPRGPRSGGGPRPGGGGPPRGPRNASSAPRRPDSDFSRGPRGGGYGQRDPAEFGPPSDANPKDTGRKRREKPAKSKRRKDDDWNEGEVRGKRGRKRDDRW